MEKSYKNLEDTTCLGEMTTMAKMKKIDFPCFQCVYFSSKDSKKEHGRIIFDTIYRDSLTHQNSKFGSKP